ncbi:helix-turn-helix domain-containing protein [Aliamphritea spongicola]|uniref:helix-turn-helix domain-containing protein n=1 Tax=Aliamphritea spongicola TaxID=707589 RepID=UPI00196A8A8E|nr:AraC family transcriptional regulator [Aliamphritea spongicola]MBN3560604.1 helix-turn-helix domain-containing protein [Aliamphritea spongicola]
MDNTEKPASFDTSVLTGLQLDVRSYTADSKSHSHDYHQLVLPVSGNLDIRIDNTSGQVDTCQGAIIAAGAAHEFAAEGSNHFLVADIPYSLARQLEQLPAFIELDDSLSHYVQFLHSQITSQQTQQPPSSQQQMLLLLIQLLNERFANTKINPDARITAVKHYIDTHYAEAVTAEQLAATANLSPRQLGQIFKAETGMTPQQYLLEKRMQTAWLLLSNTQEPIQIIADKVGYRNLAAFSDRFRKHFGHSPRYFRLHGE